MVPKPARLLTSNTASLEGTGALEEVERLQPMFGMRDPVNPEPSEVGEAEEAKRQLAIRNSLKERSQSYTQQHNSHADEGTAVEYSQLPLTAGTKRPTEQMSTPRLRPRLRSHLHSKGSETSATIPGFISPLAPDVDDGDLQVHHSSPDPVVRNNKLAASMQPWVAQALHWPGTKGSSPRLAPASGVDHPQSLQASETDTLEPRSHRDPAQLHRGQGSQSKASLYQTLSDLHGAVPPAVADGKGRSASKRSSGPRLTKIGVEVIGSGNHGLGAPPLSKTTSYWKCEDQPAATTSVEISTLASSGSSPPDDESTAPSYPNQSILLGDSASAGSSRSVAPQGRKRRRVTAALPLMRPMKAFRTSPPQDNNSSIDNTLLQTKQIRRYQGRTATANFLSDRAFSPFTPGANVVFLSHLLPRKYDRATREQFLWIFVSEAPYLPLCVVEVRTPAPTGSGTLVIWEIGEWLLAALRKMRRYFQPQLGPNGQGWPTNISPSGEHPRAMPVEMYEKIGELLPRDGVQNMRLVNREFEKKISCFAFRSVVVAFKPKIYETITEAVKVEGKGKQKETNSDDENVPNEREPFDETYDPQTSHVQDGMRVFEQWGPEIKKFALTFEVAEDTLIGLLPKKKTTIHKTFWGTYEWPNLEYNRYEQAALLEDKADETSTMTSAISKLKGLQEFGLSMLSGLGWLTGPDISDRVKLFKPKPVVFGPQYQLPDRELREAQEQWEELVEDQTRSSKRISNKKDRCFFRTRTEYLPATGMPKVVFNNNVFTNAGIRPPIMFGNINMEAREPSQLDNEDEGDGTDVAHLPWNPIAARTWSTAFEFSLALQDDPEQIRPNLLTPEQEEWLMEMQWAQGAFLSSWCIAVLDNPGVFRGLRTFNIANLSSGLLEWLQRDDVWRAMPSLENLTLLVSPDWRQVGMNRQGEIETEIICASTAQEPFYNFLSALFAWNTSIKTLHIGYVGGGENAPGMFARNQNIIPAPIMRFSNTILLDVDNTLDLRHVEHLTLSNCWLTPKATKMFFRDMTHSNLQTVAFNSVSLTADVRSGAINVAARLHVQGPRGGPLGRDHAFIVTLRNKWLLHDPRPGSWPDVIDSITPGHGIRRVRWFHGSPDIDNKPPLPAPTSLTSISFTSCGYVRLVNLFESDFDQSAIPQTIQEAPLCLKKRHAKLGEVMMESNFDGFLGTIVPALTPEDEGCLRAVWGMKMGWGEERKSEKWDVREDGMGEGGLGRFRGMVQREEEEEG